MMGSETGFHLIPTGHRYSTLPNGQDAIPLQSPFTPQPVREFDPYEEVAGRVATGPPYASDGAAPAHMNLGNGGGSDTYDDFSVETKVSQPLRENEWEIGAEHQVNEEESAGYQHWRTKAQQTDSRGIRCPTHL
jgi:hypothetical protein